MCSPSQGFYGSNNPDMKITKVSKSLTYYITTDLPDFPEYRTDETGTYWENLIGGSWKPVYSMSKEKELQEVFYDYMKQND